MKMSCKDALYIKNEGVKHYQKTYGQYEVAAYVYFTSAIITILHILQVLFFINVYMVLFLFKNVIYVFLLL